MTGGSGGRASTATAAAGATAATATGAGEAATATGEAAITEADLMDILTWNWNEFSKRDANFLSEFVN